jgi:hypothetical protein
MVGREFDPGLWGQQDYSGSAASLNCGLGEEKTLK